MGGRNIPENGQADIDEEIGPTAGDEEDAEGGYCVRKGVVSGGCFG